MKPKILLQCGSHTFQFIHIKLLHFIIVNIFSILLSFFYDFMTHNECTSDIKIYLLAVAMIRMLEHSHGAMDSYGTYIGSARLQGAILQHFIELHLSIFQVL